MNYIINDVVIVVLSQIVNEDAVEKEQSRKTKVPQLEPANHLSGMKKERSQELNQKHKSTERTFQPDWWGGHHDQVGGL